jgi:type IV pilus assembly protein PilQ
MRFKERATEWVVGGVPGISLALGGLLATLTLATAAEAAGSQLTAIEVQPRDGQAIEVRLRTTGPAPQPQSFTVDRPARLSVDLPDVSLALTSRRIDVGAGGVDNIVAVEANGRTRVVFNLDSVVPYATRVDGDSVVVSLGASPQGAAASPAARADVGVSRRVSGIDFRRAADGGGRVIVMLTDPATPASLRQEGNQVIVDFTGAQLDEEAMRRYDVVDFATPVTRVEAVRVGNSARVVVSASGAFEQMAYQSDGQYVVEIKEKSKVQLAEEKKEYAGERLTLNFQDIDVRAVLQLLADTSGQNIVVSDSVRGNLTLRLQNVPWDQALDIVLKTKGLDLRRDGNVILVAPAAEIASREKAELAALKDKQELAPLRTEYLQVNYAKSADLAKLLKSGGSGSLLSERGSVTVDDRTNTLLIQDTADRLGDIRKLIATLDIPVRQVLIESRIVIVNDDFSRDIGVRWGFTGVDAGANSLLAVSGSGNATDTMVGSALDNIASTGQPFPVTIPTGATGLANRYNVNLPVVNPSGRISMSLLNYGDYLIDLELSAAEAEGRGEIVSAPRIITANQREAVIEQGVEIPYQESSSSGATTTQFKKAVLSLKVTPQITPDNKVILDLVVSKDSVGQLVASATGGFVPSIDTREIQTQVLVNDGQTVVLGGIMETERRESEKKVPLLGSIPGLGNLFKSTSKTNNRDELLIFITPKILREGSNP